MKNEINENEPLLVASVSDSACTQRKLFELEENKIEDHYVGMPEYNNVVVPEPFITATFKFRNQEDFDFFNNFLKDNLYKEKKIFDGMQRKDKKSTWYPLNEKASKYIYEDEK
jgi:hypothetical protein